MLLTFSESKILFCRGSLYWESNIWKFIKIRMYSGSDFFLKILCFFLCIFRGKVAFFSRGCLPSPLPPLIFHHVRYCASLPWVLNSLKIYFCLPSEFNLELICVLNEFRRRNFAYQFSNYQRHLIIKNYF